MFPVAEPQGEQVLWEEKGWCFLEDRQHGNRRVWKGVVQRGNYADTLGSRGRDREGQSQRNQEERETLLIHSVNKYLMSVCYRPGTILGGLVRMEMGKIPGLCRA